ncbi:MAG: hypothetical protein JSV99_07055 [Planctomycetota bacterium]|nr:MAG: hypothetical protein JSV99_07055 [Planctomycetota bacterium]
MKRHVLISLLILLFMQAFGAARVIRVPSRTYPTIQDGINDAVDGDVVEVSPGIYTGSGNRNLDFGAHLPAGQTRAITVTSQINPDFPNWDVIAATIIDCGGKPAHSTSSDTGKANRAFLFHSGEGPNSVVIGFTIRNGYARGPKGEDGGRDLPSQPDGMDAPVTDDICVWNSRPPDWSCDPEDPNGPPRGEDGRDATGHAFGGAILCENESSPTIKYCVIKDCTVTGAEGGRGADGQDGPWDWWTVTAYRDPEDPAPINLCEDPCEDYGEFTDNSENCQCGGQGGLGAGNGYGAAIACRNKSHPIITDCIFRNNIARGGVGGDGGDGGWAATPDFGETWDGDECAGGDGGFGYGDGIGGVIYADSWSNPIITSCSFEEGTATTGLGGEGGARGLGNEADPRPSMSLDGIAEPHGYISGGAAYYNDSTAANFTNCTFTGNKAYEVSYWYQWYKTRYGVTGIFPERVYTVGGAMYFYKNNNANLSNCDFMDNAGGALYFGTNCDVNIGNAYDPNRDCLFSGNYDPNDRHDRYWRYIDRRIDHGTGGAIYVDNYCTVNLRGCNFGGNSAKNEGGALKLKSDAALTNCSFGSNIAGSFGGAIDLFDAGTQFIIDVNRCTFIGNQAVYGGAFSSEASDTVFTNCYFTNNVAEEGGALDVVLGALEITGGGISGNSATVYGGGGVNCQDNAVIIRNCAMQGNFADGPSGSGGAISLDGRASHQIESCLIVSNAATGNGGAIYCNSAAPQIEDCTFDDSLTGLYGGAIFSDWDSLPQITRSIFRSCNRHAIHEEDPGGNAVVTESLFYNNPDGDYYDSGTHSAYTGPSEIGSIPDGNNNIYGDPLFVSDGLGDYYLSQIAAGQLMDSPAVDAGSVLAVDLGLDDFTTRTDGVGDANEVDLGYHYPRFIDAPIFSLRLTVFGGEGTLEATSPEPIGYDPVCCVYWYYAGTTVILTATPEAGWRLGAWGGTDDDSSTEPTNTVLVNSNRAVTVTFEQPRTLTVGADANYPTIEAAIGDAEGGDTIIVPPGVWYGPQILIDKPVILRSADPNNPASAIIDRTDYVDRAFVFGPEAGPGTVLDGFTIQNCAWQPGLPAVDLECPGLNGTDGYSVWGGAIAIEPGASPLIKNCIIRRNWMRGGDALDGCGADDTHNAGRGGWGGFALGGGVYCGPESTPTFINCQIIDNHVGGGNGGDGGARTSATQGLPNYGGNWSAPGSAGWPDISPQDFYNPQYIPYNMELWEVWQSWGWMDVYGNFRTDYIGDYRWYTAYGGGVFCDVNSVVVFKDCTIHGNRTSGGMSGNGGEDLYDDEPEPEISYQLPSYGGGVYCAANSDVSFVSCAITENVAVRPDADMDAYINPSPNDPRAYYHLDPYLGHGGGVCAEETANLTFVDCLVGENEAAVGGGVYLNGADARIADSDIVSNVAYQGGGLLAIGGQPTIINCSITNNEAFGEVTDPNGEENDPNDYDPNDNYYLPGDGGAIHCDSTAAKIIDCVITGNRAGASGGGAHFTGPNAPSLINCLVAGNICEKGGGGASATILSQLAVSNCTITDNTVTGPLFPARYGGGLYSSDGGNVDVIDSILWGNAADLGSQIAVERAPATVSVRYSNVEDSAVDVFVDTDCVLNWLMSPVYEGRLGDPCFVSGDLGSFGRSGDFFLSQFAADPNQIVDNSCVDAGSNTAHALDFYRHTTRTDGVLDGYDPCAFPDAFVDLGYHSVLTSDLVGDFDYDGDVDIDDLYRFNLHWLEVGCKFPDWCHAKDLNQDGRINMKDYAVFAKYFQLTETIPPTPNPMTWRIPPYSPKDDLITMVATTARDNSGLDVEYQFIRVYPDYYDGWAWDPCERHFDSGVEFNQKYGYRVRARDALGNMTDWSFVGYALAGEIQIEDREPPRPDPMTWAVVPFGASASSISMVATMAFDQDSPPVQYYFEETTGLPGGTDSGWQNERTYTDGGLMAGTEYRYRVKARDGSMWLNETRWSNILGAIPDPGAVEDMNAPSPVMWDPNAINFGRPYETGAGMNAWVHMTAAVATDPEGRSVLYYFECVDIPGVYPAGYSSGWIALPTWEVAVGRTNQGLRFRFRVGDTEDGVNVINVSGWSSTLPAYPLGW